MSELTQFLLGGAAGTGLLGVFVVIYRLLFAREAREYARLDARIVMLETAYAAKSTEHINCVQEVGNLKGLIGELKGQIKQLTDDLDRAIRRHDDRNTEHVRRLQEKIRELHEQMTSQGLIVPPLDELLDKQIQIISMASEQPKGIDGNAP